MSGSAEVLHRAHLNLVDSSRHFFELDSEAAIETAEGWLFGAGSSTHPTISNAAFRRDDRLDPEDFLGRAREFFAARGRGYSVWVRGEGDEDRKLEVAAEKAGLQPVYAMPEMILEAPLDEPPLPDGVELRRVEDEEQAQAFWRIAVAAYASNGFPPEVFAGYTDHAGLWADDVATFIASLDGEPVSIAMTIVSHDIAGIYWVGSLKQARGRGLGHAVTATATNAGFELGAEVASLQASPMGRPIYQAMGYETVYDYRLLMSPPP